SLAARYKRGIDEMNSMLPQPIKRLQIIGGGSRNGLLNRLTQEATGLTVEAGPVEATAIGNVLLQAKAKGKVSAASEITEIIFK
ncbi:MAG: rhamnulokinase, partial [Muribaculaceae bacterium]|nr:rhamnulokinase [Muribaculaceae bacterium]